MSEPELIVDDAAPGVRRLRLNRPDSLNAFTYTLYEALVDALKAAAVDPALRAVIITGTGRAFTAGHDLKGSGPSRWTIPDVGKAYGDRAMLVAMSEIPLVMRRLPQPIIAAVNGVTAGIGYLIALASDMTIAARSARFVNTIHNAATGTELGMSYLLPRAVGSQRAAELLYTSRSVPADEAERIGLILRAVDDEKLMDEALAIAAAIAANVPLGIALTKQSLWINQSAGSLEAAIELEGRAVQIAQATTDAKEKRAAFWEKRAPQFTNR